MKPAKKFAVTMRAMTDEQCREIAANIAAEVGVIFPLGKTGKTALRIVAREARLAAGHYTDHKEALLNQLALMGA